MAQGGTVTVNGASDAVGASPGRLDPRDRPQQRRLRGMRGDAGDGRPGRHRHVWGITLLEMALLKLELSVADDLR